MMELIKNRTFQIAVVVLVAVGALFLVSKAKAADKGGPKAAAPAASSDSIPSWTGLGFDVHGALVNGSADFGAPVTIGMDGQMAGLTAFYRHRFGPLVLGGDVGYDRVWGDLHSTLGINDAWTVGATAGLLATDRTLIYTRGEWIRVEASGAHVNGWGMGGGVEVKLANTPASLALEYMHDWYDNNAFGPGVNVSSDRIMTRVRFDFGRDVTKIFADR